MNRPDRIRPEYAVPRARAVRDFYLPAAALLVCHATRSHVEEVAKAQWPRERDLALSVKAVTDPASMTDADWASATVGMGVADFPSVLSAASASRTLLPLGQQFAFGRAGLIRAPQLTADGGSAVFIEENKPVPVRKYSISGGPILKPKKLATISVFSREVFEHSVPTIETTVATVIGEDFGLGLDAKMLDDTAADDARPAGLRNGILAGAESANTTRSEAMAEDISTLITGVAPVAGNAPIVLIANPLQAAALRLWNNPRFDFPVLASAALDAGTVIALATNCLVSAVDPVPRFEVSRNAVLHFDDASPADIAVAGAPPAGLVKSAFQADLLCLKAVLTCSWGLRAAAGLSWIENTLW